VKGSQTTDDLNDDLPNVLLLHELLIVLALTDALEDITVVGELHYDAKTDVRGQEELIVDLPEGVRWLVEECLFVGGDKGVVD